MKLTIIKNSNKKCSRRNNGRKIKLSDNEEISAEKEIIGVIEETKEKVKQRKCVKKETR